jgi:hypothetical protein
MGRNLWVLLLLILKCLVPSVHVHKFINVSLYIFGNVAEVGKHRVHKQVRVVFISLPFVLNVSFPDIELCFFVFYFHPEVVISELICLF